MDGLSDVYFPLFTDHLNNPLGNARTRWARLASEFRVFKGDCDNLMSLGKQSPTKGMFDYLSISSGHHQ